MEKKLVVIADTDEEYISALEYKLIEEWGETVEIHVISQLKYFNEFFSQPRSIYVLLIDKYLYNDKVKKQNCDYVFILSEDEESNNFNVYQDKSCYQLLKYSSIKEIYAEIMRRVRISAKSESVEGTKLYMVYSPIGGCGKTVCALGISEKLAEFGKKVLYINMESLQNFNYYLNDKDWARPVFGYAMGSGTVDLQRDLMPEIGNEKFDYLKPLEKAPVTYHITEKMYLNLIEKIKSARLYDIIVLEVSSEFTEEKVRWMDRMDKIFVICMQDVLSVSKLEYFLKNIVYQEDRFLFVCNRFKQNQENELGALIMSGKISVCEYIDEKEDGMMNLMYMQNEDILKTTAYMLE